MAATPRIMFMQFVLCVMLSCNDVMMLGTHHSSILFLDTHVSHLQHYFLHSMLVFIFVRVCVCVCVCVMLSCNDVMMLGTLHSSILFLDTHVSHLQHYFLHSMLVFIFVRVCVCVCVCMCVCLQVPLSNVT